MRPVNNVWTIFKHDLKHLGKNAISWVVVIGLVVIPSLYAWFCIYAFWDPYNHTEHLKVAVASVDEGYESSLIPIQINIGKEVLDQLRDNPQMDWVFVSRKEAIEGVRSGKYYAALVIPKDFSRNLLSILSNDVTSAKILYYINEKENAIAAKVSNQGATTIQRTIDESVAETASSVALNTLETISDIVNDEDIDALADNLSQQLQSISDELNSSADIIDNLCNINVSLDNLLKATDDLLTEVGSNASAAVQDMESIDVSFDTMENDLNQINGKIDTVLQNTGQAYNAVNDAAGQYLRDMNTDAVTISSSLNTFADRVQTIIGRYQELQRNVQNLADALPEEMNVSRGILNGLAVSLDRSIRQQVQIHDTLTNAASDLTETSSDALRYQKELSDYISRCSQDTQNLRGRFQNEIKPEILSLGDSLSRTKESVSSVKEGLDASVTSVRAFADTVSGQMDQLNQNLASTRDLLRGASDKISSILQQIQEDDGTGKQELLKRLLSNDTGTVSNYFSSVVKLDSHIIYPVENFGTAMTPFYTGLAIWVGAIILVAMLKVDVSEKILALLNQPKNWQLYLGRFGVFLLLSLLQSLLASAGDLFFLGVKCVHPLLFLLTCLYIGLVFVTLIYTLTASFGNIGKAVAVILLVFQVAGSGGTLPIEMTPSFFHIFYPLLPMTHAMGALRECVAGMYGNDYYTELWILSIYIWISLIMGLILRNPMIRLNHMFEEKLESTKVI